MTARRSKISTSWAVIDRPYDIAVIPKRTRRTMGIVRQLSIVAFSAIVLLIAASPVFAQVDLSGSWDTRQHEDALERGGGPEIGEYQGIPINDADRFRAEAWSASIWTVPEYQCIPHPADYAPSFSNLRIWKDVDPRTNEVTAWHTQMAWMTPTRTIWMDGRSHPPEYTAHTWQGFSTGKWDGDMLTIETTHLKPA